MRMTVARGVVEGEGGSRLQAMARTMAAKAAAIVVEIDMMTAVFAEVAGSTVQEAGEAAMSGFLVSSWTQKTRLGWAWRAWVAGEARVVSLPEGEAMWAQRAAGVSLLVLRAPRVPPSGSTRTI